MVVVVAARAWCVGSIVGGVRGGVRRWTVLGVLWSLLAVAGWFLLRVRHLRLIRKGIGALLIVVAWLAGWSRRCDPAWIRRRVGGRVRERLPWPEPTAQSRQWSVRYALSAYVITFVGVLVLAAGLYFGLGVQLHIGVGGLVVDAILLRSLVPLKLEHRLPAGILICGLCLLRDRLDS